MLRLGLAKHPSRLEPSSHFRGLRLTPSASRSWDRCLALAESLSRISEGSTPDRDGSERVRGKRCIRQSDLLAWLADIGYQTMCRDARKAGLDPEELVRERLGGKSQRFEGVAESDVEALRRINRRDS